VCVPVFSPVFGAHGVGDGTFLSQATYPVGDNPGSVATGDFNGDGMTDLATSNASDHNVSVLLNVGDGTFLSQATYPVGESPTSVATSDFNGDGVADLVTASRSDDNVSVLLGVGDGTFFPQTTYAAREPNSVATGDFNGDGSTDLATANSLSNSVSVLLNQCGADGSSIAPDAFTVFRGFYQSGDLSDVRESDDSYLKFNPGITMFPTEPPVWIAFEGTLPFDNPQDLSVTLEASVNTVGISQTIEMFNWNSQQYELVDTHSASFNSDSVVTVDLTGNVTDYVEVGTGTVKSRVGWKKSGLIILFPWTVCIDQVVWSVAN
jgi:hypothetical protein